MENFRLKLFLAASAFAAASATLLFASGDWYDQSPPTLDEYLERLPAKSVGQILAETHPATSAKAPQVHKAVAALGRRAKSEPAEKLIAEVDSLLASARAAHSAPADLSLIHDTRDVLVSAPEKASAYIDWRCEHFDEISPEWKAWKDGNPPAIPEGLAEKLDANAGNAAKPLRAHWLYLRAALSYNYGQKGDASPLFYQVVHKYPEHPRAELALFMNGRCLVSVSRSSQYSEKRIGDQTAHDGALKCFKDYLRRYPKGRFVADAYGWLGALAWDENDPVAALKWYIAQAETPDHPEDQKSAAIMIEKALRAIAQNPKTDGEAYALIAHHPQAGMATLYLLLGASDSAGAIDRYEEQPKDPAAKLREWRSKLLPKLASAVAASKETYQSQQCQPRYLAILAHAASNAGKQEEALRVLALAPKGVANDDVLFAKAIVLQRAGKAKEAIPVFQSLLEHFPKSPLAPGVHIRLALAFRDTHQAGRALVQLRKLAEKSADTNSAEYHWEDEQPLYMSPPDAEINGIESVFYPNYRNAEKSQVDQAIDTLLNFAPIPELAGALDDAQLEPGFVSDLRAILAARSLAHEDFATAKTYMTPAQYALLAANLEKLTSQIAQGGSPQEKAEAGMRLGDAWAAAHGRLLGIPLDTAFTKEEIFGHNPIDAEALRKRNGRTMGFKGLDAELEAREELRHATHCWFEAARAMPGTPLSAAARLKVLEAQAVIAQTSDYGFERAVATGLAGVSRQIYDRLKTESPDSPEAACAAYWNTPGPITAHSNWRGDPDYRCHVSGYRWPDFEAFGEFSNVDDRDELNAVAALRTLRNDLPKLKERLAFLRHTLKQSTASRNTVEDLALFLEEPAATPDVVSAYVNLRLDTLACAYTGGGFSDAKVADAPAEADIDTLVRKRIQKAASESKMAPVHDYLDFLDIAVVANHRVSVPTEEMSKGEAFAFYSRDYPELEKLTRAFLKNHPESKKREAAQLLLARAVFRQSWPSFDYVEEKHAEAKPVIPGEPKSYQREKLKPERVMNELNAYDGKYPNGRYAADIRAMRAALLWRLGSDWPGALRLTIEALDKGPSDLKEDAALRLANIFAELKKPQQRPALLAAIRKNPRAVELLQTYLDKAHGNLQHPLLLMGGFLGDQLGFRFDPKPPKKAEQ